MNTRSTTSTARGSRLRSVLIVLVLTVAALLLPLGAPTARAAPPGVSASENPVIIAIKTKEITLTWTLAPFQLAGKLTVTENGTQTEVFNQMVSSLTGTGTVPLKVSYPETYTAQLTDSLTNQPVGAPLTITTKKADTSIPVDPCNLHVCITNVGVEPHGGWAQFTIDTNQKAIMTLEASPAPPNADGTWSNPDDVASDATTILPTQSWTPQIPLHPNVTYFYAVRAHDTNGHEQVKTGSFKTLTRRVDVTFAEIQMIDDSDGFGAGDCDCFFWFNAGNVSKPYGSLENQKSIASGTSVHPNVTVTVMNAPNEILIRAHGSDDDADFGEFCAAGIFTPSADNEPWEANWAGWEPNEFNDGCLDWSANQTRVSVSRRGNENAPGEVDEQFTEPFTISSGGPLIYTVRGTYKVTYVP